MEKLITSTSQITTTVTSNATGKNTYAIERTLSNVKGDTAIIVLLYPTISSTRPFSEDSNGAVNLICLYEKKYSSVWSNLD